MKLPLPVAPPDMAIPTIPATMRQDHRHILEIFYSLFSGLSIQERATKYGKTVQFLTELDKALAFSQPPLQIEGDKINSMLVKTTSTVKSFVETKRSNKRKSNTVLDMALLKRPPIQQHLTPLIGMITRSKKRKLSETQTL